MTDQIQDGGVEQSDKPKKFVVTRRTLVLEYAVEAEDSYPNNTEQEILDEEYNLSLGDVIDLLYDDVTIKQGAVSTTFTDEEPAAWDGEERVGHEPVYIVDWEADDENPIVVQVEVTKVLGGDPSPQYLGQLIAESAGGIFNMAVAENESSALQAVENAKDDEPPSEEDEQAARLNALRHIN